MLENGPNKENAYLYFFNIVKFCSLVSYLGYLFWWLLGDSQSILRARILSYIMRGIKSLHVKFI